MIEEIGVVREVQTDQEAQIIWVETQVKSTCGSCEAQASCGTGAIAKVFAKKRQKLKYDYAGDVLVGQKVKLGIPEESLLKASGLMYLLPLLVLITSALVAQSTLPMMGLTAEVWVILVAFSATGLSFSAIRYYLTQPTKEGFKPQLIAVIPTEIQNIQVKQV